MNVLLTIVVLADPQVPLISEGEKKKSDVQSKRLFR